MELIRRLDCQRMNIGWQTITLLNPYGVNGCYYGVHALGLAGDSDDQDLCEFLIFGGSNKD